MIKFIGYFVISVALILYRGLCLSYAWNVTLAPGLGTPELNIPLAIMISMLASMLTFQTSHQRLSWEEVEELGRNGSIQGFIISTMIVLMGWILSYWIV